LRENDRVGYVPAQKTFNDTEPEKVVRSFEKEEEIKKANKPEETAVKADFKTQDTSKGGMLNSLKAKLTSQTEKLKEKYLNSRQGEGGKRQVAMAALVPILAIVLIIILTQVLSGPSPKGNTTNFSPSSAAASTTNKELSWEVPEPYPLEIRDPMQFGVSDSVKEQPSGLILRGIVYSEDSPSAIIGNQIIKEGETIYGAKVVKINRSSVEFNMDGKTWIQRVQR
jgi:hypothetical protein